METDPEIIHDIGDPTPHLPGVFIPLWVWIILAVVVLGLLLVLVAAIVMARRKRPTPSTNPDEAYIFSRGQLKKLRDALDGMPLAEVATQASFALRYYLAACLEEPALYETHEEFTLRVDALEKLPAGSREHLNPLLERLAECKYGPSRQDEPVARTLVDDCLEVLQGIDSTRPRTIA